MSEKGIPLATRLAMWWLRNYEGSVFFWVRMNWAITLTIFIIGALKGSDLGFIGLVILVVALISNTGLYFALRAMRVYLLNLPEDAPGREEVHDLLIYVMERRARHYEEHYGKYIKK